MKEKLQILREIIISNPEAARDLYLATSQMEIIRLVNICFAVTTTDVSKHFNITLQNGSAKLKNLWGKGYLIRTKLTSPSGGDIYEYSLVPELRRIYIPKPS